MAKNLNITGIKAMLRKLGGVQKGYEARANRGLVDGGLLLQGESQDIVPVQFGPLRASAFTRLVAKLHVIVGYTSLYAVFVHENKKAAHGQAFNRKHREAISRANKRLVFNASGQVTGQRAGERRSGTFFNRGEDQQAKFLEKPFKDKKVRREILNVLANRMRGR